MKNTTLGMCIALFLCAPRLAHSAGIVVLTDSQVAQYRQVLQAAKEVAPSLVAVEQGVPTWQATLQAAAPEVILVVGSGAFNLLKGKQDVPIVYCMVLRNLTDEAKGATGVTFEVSPATQLGYFKQLTPTRKRIGVIYEPAASGAFMAEANRAAAAQGLSLISRELTDPKQISAAAKDLVDKVDALWLLPDPKLISGEVFRFLLSLMTERKIPIYGFLENFTQAGALASVSADYVETGRQAARIASSIVGKHGALPPPVPSPGSLSVNLKIAQQLGIEIPANVLEKARKVIK